ncbi:Pyrroline-5-carboxylate reductase [Lachnospiraceae bacterium TWA4]|nr:Pyrroline-5-carboxylate reductase [Lachnospiraceae bacterium TWA4]
MNIGFIGCGNMGGALIKGILSQQIAKPSEVFASDKGKDTNQIRKEFGEISAVETNIKVVKSSDLVILSIKPQYYEEVIREIKDVVTKDQLVISIAPGKTLEWLEKQFQKPVKLVRVMPNTPALVGEGMMATCIGELVSKEEAQVVIQLLASCGRVEVVDESLMDVVVSVSGSSPAYVFLFIEAMADAAVADGMPRAMAYEFAAQSVLGSAKLLLETKKHPGELKDMVCSPAGTTIEAVRVLEEKGFRSSVIEAMKACTKKAKEV